MNSKVTEQYAALAAQAEEVLRQRADGDRIRIQVGSATCEHAAGSDEVLDEFRKHIAASGRDDIVLHQTGCTGRCSREPIVGVLVPGQMPVKYERVDRELVHEIFTQHIQQGQPVLDHVLDGPIEKLAALRDPRLRQRPLRLERAEDVLTTLLAEKLRAAGHRARAGPRHAGQLLRRLQRGRGRASARTCWSGPTRCSTACSDEADLDEIIREHLQRRQVGRAACRCRARPSAGSSSSSTATWRSSTGRAASPCGTTA